MARAAAALAAAAGAAGWEIQLPMRDGFTLGTAVNCPKDGTGLTVIMDRSTYTQAEELIAEALAAAVGGVQAGFCSIRQDMRGTGFSNHVGRKHEDFTLWHKEANDTYDTLQWVAQQPWSSGRAFTIGASSDGLGSVVMPLSVPTAPPQLKGQFILVASALPHGFSFPGGAYRAGLNEGWTDAVFPLQHKRLLEEIRAHEAPGAWWDPVNVTAHCDRVDWPSVMSSGWYDIFVHGNLIAYDCWNKRSGPGGRGKTRIVVGTDGHCVTASSYFDHGVVNDESLAMLEALDMIKGTLAPNDTLKSVTFYVMGAGGDAPGNHWTTLDDFPEYTPTAYYLTPDGGLSPAAPAAGAVRNYTYDPANPVPTNGGNNLYPLATCGPLDQAESEKRDDVLIFSSDPLADAVALTGPVDATLFVSSDMPDTDFTAKLTDVFPNGTSRLVQDGIVRMRWRAGVAGGTDPLPPLQPGVVYEAGVSLWNTSYVFAAGHRLRVAVSSSNSPRFEVNPNNALPLSDPGSRSAAQVAANALHIGGSSPSRIVLPVVPLSALPPKDMRQVVDTWLAARPEYRPIVERVRREGLRSFGVPPRALQ